MGVPQQQPGEPITTYGLLVGEFADWTLGEIHAAFQQLDNRTLLDAAGLGIILSVGFQHAFGEIDMRFRRAATMVAAVGSVLSERGIHIQEALNPETAFEAWRASLATAVDAMESVPTHRLSRLRAVVREALASLPEHVEPSIRQRLAEALESVDSLLRERGVLGDDIPRGEFQA